MKSYSCISVSVILDRVLTFKAHLHKVAAKLKIRIGLINKIAGNSWGAATYKCSLGFFYSPGLHGRRVLHPSVGRKHPHRGGRCPNQKDHAHISGRFEHKRLIALLGQTKIEPPHIKRQNSVLKGKSKINRHQELLIDKDGMAILWLKSQKLFLQRALTITKARKITLDEWQAAWTWWHPQK